MRPRIRVVSEDGWRFDVTHAETGERIPGVRGITVKAPSLDELATVELELLAGPIDVVGNLEAIEFVTIQGERRRFELPAGSREVPVSEPLAAETKA